MPSKFDSYLEEEEQVFSINMGQKQNLSPIRTEDTTKNQPSKNTSVDIVPQKPVQVRPETTKPIIKTPITIEKLQINTIERTSESGQQPPTPIISEERQYRQGFLEKLI